MTVKFRANSRSVHGGYDVLVDGEVIGFVFKFRESYTGIQRGGTYTYWTPGVEVDGKLNYLVPHGSWGDRTFTLDPNAARRGTTLADGTRIAQRYNASTRKDAVDALLRATGHTNQEEK